LVAQASHNPTRAAKPKAMMAGNVHEQVEAIFPNLRLRVRDLCHAVRRLCCGSGVVDWLVDVTSAN